MRILGQIWTVVSSTLAAGLLAAWATIPFFTTEAGSLFFFVGAGMGLVGSVGALSYQRRRNSPTAE